MATLVRHNGPSLISDLMSWVESASNAPEIRVEEYDADNRHVIRADIPGVDPRKDIQLTVDKGLLKLRGERREEQHDKHRTEIRYGSFERVLALPRGTKPEDVKADYADGVLTVSVPTDGSEEPQAIPVTHQEPSTD
jgi:HSP20 family protein